MVLTKNAICHANIDFYVLDCTFFFFWEEIVLLLTMLEWKWIIFPSFQFFGKEEYHNESWVYFDCDHLDALVGPITIFIELRNTIVCSHYKQIILSNENYSLIIIIATMVNQLDLKFCSFAY